MTLAIYRLLTISCEVTNELTLERFVIVGEIKVVVVCVKLGLTSLLTSACCWRLMRPPVLPK